MTKSAVARWDFTLPEDVATVPVLKSFLGVHCKKYCFQLEQGEETGFMHYQGRVSLKVKSRKGPTLDKIHWSPTSTAASDDDFYVLKNDTRIKGPWQDTDPYIPRQIRSLTLYDWQQSIIDDANVWNTRDINCIICKSGNIGKSTLCTYVGSHKLGRKIPILESYKDFMRMVMDTPKMQLYLVDCPRSMQKTSCSNFWSAIETVKDGYAYDDRYGFRESYFDCPNIWVFCNDFPDTTFLSVDRWKYWEVTKDKKLSPLHKALRCNTNYVTTGTTGTERLTRDGRPLIPRPQPLHGGMDGW